MLASDPSWVHRSNHKQNCATEQSEQITILYNQSLWWRPESTSHGILPQWLCGRSIQWKFWFRADHNTRAAKSYIQLIWNHHSQLNGGCQKHHDHTIWSFQAHNQVVHPNREGIKKTPMQKTPPLQIYRSLLKYIFWFKIVDYTVKNTNLGIAVQQQKISGLTFASTYINPTRM